MKAAIVTSIAICAVSAGVGCAYGWPYALIAGGAMLWLDITLALWRHRRKDAA